jgi:hypothetical protein
MKSLMKVLLFTANITEVIKMAVDAKPVYQLTLNRNGEKI